MGDLQAADRHRRGVTGESRLTGVEVVLALVVGAGIGVVMGLLGAGGSILTVPALMLLLGFTATQATGTSLIVVAVIATAGLVMHGRDGRVDWHAGLVFAIVGIPAAAFGGRASVLIPDAVLTIVLVALLAATAVWMWRRRAPQPRPRSTGLELPRLVPAGLGVGAVTGLLGVGGGFVVVPSLSSMLGLPIPVAIGTSQLVLVVNALAGLGGRFGSGVVDLRIGLVLAGGGAAGSIVASRLAGRLGDRALVRLFATLLAVAAVALLVDLLV